MVVENFFSSTEKNSHRKALYLGAPFSRASAFCLDSFVVIWPLVHFLSFLEKPFFVFFLVFAFYEAFLLSFYKKTLGQLIMKLYTVDEKGDALSFPFAFVRGLFSAVNVMFFFLPSLRLFKDIEKRQTFQDKIANSLVLSQVENKEKDYHFEIPVLRNLRHSFIFGASFLWAFLLVFSFADRSKKDETRSLASVNENREKISAFCQDVDGKEPSFLRERLGKSIFLFDEKKISRSCLKKEAKISFCRSDLKDLSYLAYALIYKDESQVSKKYLREACHLVLKKDKEFVLEKEIKKGKI